MNNTTLHPSSQPLAHLIDLFLFKGPPKNLDADNGVEILINHGFVTGYSPKRLQPVWSAYRVAHADRSVDYDRPHLYYADDRLDAEYRVGPETFGRHDGIQYNVGHMVPNEAINTQFGRLAQLETFFMSNMSPQRGSLNSGIWLKLENKIRNIEDTPQKDHVWAMVGPVFSATPDTITRRNGQEVPIPSAYYCILVDPFRYPWNQESNVDIACFIIPQDTHRNTPLESLMVDISEIEQATALEFFPGWENDVASRSETLASPRSRRTRSDPAEATSDAWERHRLLRQL